MLRRSVTASTVPAPAIRPHLGHRSPIHRVWIIYGSVVALYGLVFSLWQLQPAPLSIDAAGTLVAAICMYPFARWYRDGKQGIPMFELICISYLLQFATPVFMQPNSVNVLSRTMTFTWAQSFQCLMIVAAATFTLVVSYYVTRASGLARRVPTVNLRLAAELRARYLVAATFVGLGLSLMTSNMLFHVPVSLLTVVSTLEYQFTIAIVLVAFRVYRGESRGFRWQLLLYGAIALQTVIGLSTGMLEWGLDPIILLLLIRWTVTGKLPIIPVLLGVAMVIILNPVKQEYRQQAWYSGAHHNPVQSLQIWLSLSDQTLQQTATGDVGTNVQSLIRSSTARLDFFHVFEWIQQETPKDVAYANGSSYTYFAYAWIPRFVWPDKPVANAPDTALAVSYGFLTADQINSVSIGLGHIGLGYANFGLLGVLLVMTFQGVAFALLNASLNGAESEGGNAMYLALLVPFLNGVGGSTANMFGSLLQALFLNGIILRLFTRRGREEDAQSPRRPGVRSVRPYVSRRRPAPRPATAVEQVVVTGRRRSPHANEPSRALSA